MAHFVNMEELDKLGTEIHNYAKTSIREEIDRLLNLREKYVWQGVASDAFFDKYKEIMTKLYDYSDMVEMFGYFLRYVASGYENVRDESGEMFRKFIEEKSEEKKKYLWERG